MQRFQMIEPFVDSETKSISLPEDVTRGTLTRKTQPMARVTVDVSSVRISENRVDVSSVKISENRVDVSSVRIRENRVDVSSVRIRENRVDVSSVRIHENRVDYDRKTPEYYYGEQHLGKTQNKAAEKANRKDYALCNQKNFPETKGFFNAADGTRRRRYHNEHQRSQHQPTIHTAPHAASDIIRVALYLAAVGLINFGLYIFTRMWRAASYLIDVALYRAATVWHAAPYVAATVWHAASYLIDVALYRAATVWHAAPYVAATVWHAASYLIDVALYRAATVWHAAPYVAATVWHAASYLIDVALYRAATVWHAAGDLIAVGAPYVAAVAVRVLGGMAVAGQGTVRIIGGVVRFALDIAATVADIAPRTGDVVRRLGCHAVRGAGAVTAEIENGFREAMYKAMGWYRIRTVLRPNEEGKRSHEQGKIAEVDSNIEKTVKTYEEARSNFNEAAERDTLKPIKITKGYCHKEHETIVLQPEDNSMEEDWLRRFAVKSGAESKTRGEETQSKESSQVIS